MKFRLILFLTVLVPLISLSKEIELFLYDQQRAREQ